MITVVVTITLAFVGYAATYLNGMRLSQRQERLARLNRQLVLQCGFVIYPVGSLAVRRR
ncbi:hypothetical protein ACFWFI_13875 [Streptomyces sp. NPDC060209]|uniref:hypothetical protein n=1 Tax=Streptomyces sp. NPDC060209 TaxID=3347073 RepID=UPI003665C4B7